MTEDAFDAADVVDAAFVVVVVVVEGLAAVDAAVAAVVAGGAVGAVAEVMIEAAPALQLQHHGIKVDGPCVVQTGGLCVQPIGETWSYYVFWH